jgi:hypothetical protein
MKSLTQRPTRPVELNVDFTVSEFEQEELAFLSPEVDHEFLEQEHVAVSPCGVKWTILKVGRWRGDEALLEGRKVVISGVGKEIQKSFTGKALLQRVRPAALQSVVLTVSEEEYDLIAGDRDAFRRLRDEGIVFRTSKTFALNDVKVQVSLCEPVRQGILGDDTEIILVTAAHHKGPVSNGVDTPFSTTSHDESASDFDILQFLSLPSSEDGLDASGEDTLLPPDGDAIARGIPLKAVVLQRPIDRHSLDPRPADSEDPEFRVYGNVGDIARIGVFSGDWVPSALTQLT